MTGDPIKGIHINCCFRTVESMVALHNYPSESVGREDDLVTETEAGEETGFAEGGVLFHCQRLTAER